MVSGRSPWFSARGQQDSEIGQALVEWALILALVAVAVMTIWTLGGCS